MLVATESCLKICVDLCRALSSRSLSHPKTLRTTPSKEMWKARRAKSQRICVTAICGTLESLYGTTILSNNNKAHYALTQDTGGFHQRSAERKQGSCWRRCLGYKTPTVSKVMPLCLMVGQSTNLRDVWQSRPSVERRGAIAMRQTEGASAQTTVTPNPLCRLQKTLTTRVFSSGSLALQKKLCEIQGSSERKWRS